MRQIETLPNWALRLTERSARRRTDNRIIRWLKLPAPKRRVGTDRPMTESQTPERSSNDNLVPFPSRAAM